jgi:hypothetical protein
MRIGTEVQTKRRTFGHIQFLKNIMYTTVKKSCQMFDQQFMQLHIISSEYGDLWYPALYSIIHPSSNIRFQ